LEQETPFGQQVTRQQRDCIGSQGNGFQIDQDLLGVMGLEGVQFSPDLAGTLCQTTRAHLYIVWFVVPVTHPGLDEFKEVLGDEER